MVKIPEPFAWDESFAVFYTNIDDEHKVRVQYPKFVRYVTYFPQGLFDGIFAVCESPADSGALDILRTKVKDHFSHEEAMLEKIADDYDVVGHKKKHAEFLATAAGLTTPVSQDNCIFMKVIIENLYLYLTISVQQWLVDHITNTDFGYKGKL